MSEPVNLNVVKWLQLCDLAAEAVKRPDRHASDLIMMAGRLTTVTLSPPRMDMISLTTSFRWDCSAFGHANGPDREALAAGLLAKAAIVRRRLSPEEPQGRVALPIPQAVEPDLPAWTQRRDIGGA